MRYYGVDEIQPEAIDKNAKNLVHNIEYFGSNFFFAEN
jgi:hypothetical protein